MAPPKIRARYKVVGPKMSKVEVTKARIDETKSLITEKVIEVKLMWMVYFPQGHSIRVDAAELKRRGLDMSPRLVDMNTGDVLDEGGDPYDLSGDVEIEDRDLNLVDEEFELPSSVVNSPSQEAKKVKA